MPVSPAWEEMTPRDGIHHLHAFGQVSETGKNKRSQDVASERIPAFPVSTSPRSTSFGEPSPSDIVVHTESHFRASLVQSPHPPTHAPQAKPRKPGQYTVSFPFTPGTKAAHLQSTYPGSRGKGRAPGASDSPKTARWNIAPPSDRGIFPTNTAEATEEKEKTKDKLKAVWGRKGGSSGQSAANVKARAEERGCLLGAFSLCWPLGLIRSGGDSGEVVLPDSAPGEPEIVGGAIGEDDSWTSKVLFTCVFFWAVVTERWVWGYYVCVLCPYIGMFV